MNKENINQFISELRKEKNLTQKELAEQLGVTDKAVSKWERGLSCPDIALLPNLSRILGATTSELLSGKKADSSMPEVDAMIETTLHYADAATKSKIAKNMRWKYAAIGLAISLLSISILFLGNAAMDHGLTRAFLPGSIIGMIWLMALLAVFITRKNKIASVLLCGFCIYLTTYYFASLNQAVPRNIAEFNGFEQAGIPHYTIIMIMFLISVVVLAVTFWGEKKNFSTDIVFLLGSVNLTLILLSVLTVSAIVDYVDINGLGVNSTFTILLLLLFLMNCLSIALLVRRSLKQK